MKLDFRPLVDSNITLYVYFAYLTQLFQCEEQPYHVWPWQTSSRDPIMVLWSCLLVFKHVWAVQRNKWFQIEVAFTCNRNSIFVACEFISFHWQLLKVAVKRFFPHRSLRLYLENISLVLVTLITIRGRTGKVRISFTCRERQWAILFFTTIGSFHEYNLLALYLMLKY